MTRLGHAAGPGSFTRDFTIFPEMNRLHKVIIGGTPYSYVYDPNGNMTEENTSRHFEWDHSDRMRVFRNQASSGQPTVYTHYIYDSNGQRVKKLTRKQNGTTVLSAVYIHCFYEHHTLWKSNVSSETSYLHIVDAEKRIAIRRIAISPDAQDDSPAIQYQLGDHLGSSTFLVDADGNWITSEEFTPYGETSFGGFAKKRYRFTGKERDEESGLNYHNARYYAVWLGKWISCDPDIMADSASPYIYAGSNPVCFTDTSGRQREPRDAGTAHAASSDAGLPPTDAMSSGRRAEILSGGNVNSLPSNITADDFKWVPAHGGPDMNLKLYLRSNSLSFWDWVRIAASFYFVAYSLRGGPTANKRNPQSTSPVGQPKGLSGPAPGRTFEVSLAQEGSPQGKILWGSWNDYPKVTINGQDFAKVGNRLYTRHAVDRMQPSGFRYSGAGEGKNGGMPQIRQTGGNYDYGRGVAPQYVEDTIAASKGVAEPATNTIKHTAGSLEVILNKQGAVVTIIVSVRWRGVLRGCVRW